MLINEEFMDPDEFPADVMVSVSGDGDPNSQLLVLRFNGPEPENKFAMHATPDQLRNLGEFLREILADV